MYFATNKVNYARYGSFYLHTLIHLDNIYPGLRDLLKRNGISVQGQESYPLRTAIDQRGEQTINRDGKTSGKRNSIYLTWINFRVDKIFAIFADF